MYVLELNKKMNYSPQSTQRSRPRSSGINLKVMFNLRTGRVWGSSRAAKRLEPIHIAQVLSYLKLSGCRVGLLINFNVKILKAGIRRLVYD